MPIEPDNVLMNKCAIIERALNRIREEYRAEPGYERCALYCREAVQESD